VRVLLVDDEPAIRALLKATLASVDMEVDEAPDAATARDALAAQPPDAIVLDVNLPDVDGLRFCAELKGDERTRSIPVVLLTASQVRPDAIAGADAFLQKPFSPLELLSLLERVVGGVAVPLRPQPAPDANDEQLLLYARDLRYLLELERAQRRSLENAYRETVLALASALESRDLGTAAHSQRVRRYALELARRVDAGVAADAGAEYGFLLHDVGKIGIPDQVLLKPGELDEDELRLMRMHTLIGVQMLERVTFLQPSALPIVRSHHERWDGGGYPDGLGRDEIPLGARIFSLADALDAITSDRPYRPAQPWEVARAEIVAQAGRQFDPGVVDAFFEVEDELQEARRELVRVDRVPS
jgi:response regulator RpfG family c-di-GMP phosphodiesterase